MPDEPTTEATGAGNGPPPIRTPRAHLSTIRVVHWGMVLWAVALVMVLLVPALHEGSRSWWAWVPVSGFTLGVIGHVYLARGRGNAADA